MRNYATLKKVFLVASMVLSTSGLSVAFATTSPTVVVAPRPDLPPLPIEQTGNVEVLPNDFPQSWMFVDESSFMSMFGGKMILLDVAEPKAAKRIKGTADKNLLGNFIQAKTRPEFYIM